MRAIDFCRGPETIPHMSFPDHYAELGVAPDSEDVVIRAAYKALMMKYHPDRNPGAEAEGRARRINLAYAILGDAAARRAYDIARNGARAAPPPPPPRPSPPPGPQPPPATAPKASGPSTQFLTGVGTVIFFLCMAIYRCSQG
jgi:curved DNA-binding protein CbpA